MTERDQGKNTPGKRAPQGAFAAPDHDHGHCMDEALAAAEAQCRARGARLTPQRRRVLELVWNSHAPVGAYSLLDRMREAGERAQPPTVYRALDFLVGQRLVHRIESLNAYVGCARPADKHVGQFLICTRCRTAAELDDAAITAAIARRAGEVGFSVTQATVEIAGLCPNCRAG